MQDMEQGSAKYGETVFSDLTGLSPQLRLFKGKLTLMLHMHVVSLTNIWGICSSSFSNSFSDLGSHQNCCGICMVKISTCSNELRH